jgi:hypothetical protein
MGLEGYTDGKTEEATRLKEIDDVIKEIHFLNSKPKTAGTANDNGRANDATSSTKYLTDENAKNLEDLLRKGEIGADIARSAMKQYVSLDVDAYNSLISQVHKDDATGAAEPDAKTTYNKDAANVTYHEDPSKLADKDVMIRGPDGNMIKWTDAVKIDARYNNAGHSRYSPSNYVPDYEDSVFLSRLSSYSINAPVVDYGFGLGPNKSGFCKSSENNSIETENQCNKLDANTCASTSCCALLGGTKCVAGNESGPINKANYSDISVANRDYYYFQGKCYGNCQ